MLTVDALNTYAPGKGLSGYPTIYYDGMRWNPTERRLDTQHGYYGGFTRVFMPAGSQFLGGAGFDEGAAVSAEGGRPVAGGYLGLGMGAYRRLQLEWAPNVTPSAAGRYRLVVQRQPGAPGHALSVRVSLPAGFTARDIEPPPWSAEGLLVTWRARLDEDRQFQLTLEPAR
jgi:hypothetical protein